MNKRIFGALFVAAAWGHLFYPAVVGAASRFGTTVPLRRFPSPECVPDYSVVIPAYLEHSTIGECVRMWWDNGASEVVVVVDDDPLTAQAAADVGATVDFSDWRGGKHAALNRAVPKVKHSVVLLADTNTRMGEASAARLVDHVAEGRADVVGGVKVENGESESRYWRFDNWLKECEERLGGCPLLVGEAICMRRETWEPIPDHAASDDLHLTGRSITRGLRVRVDTSVRAHENSTEAKGQHRRRYQLVSMVMHQVVADPHNLLGLDRGHLILAGHKLFRVMVAPAAQVALLGHPLGWLQLPPVLDYVHSARTGRELHGMRGLAAQSVGMPVVVWVHALWDLRNRHTRSWKKVAR